MFIDYYRIFFGMCRWQERLYWVVCTDSFNRSTPIQLTEGEQHAGKPHKNKSNTNVRVSGTYVSTETIVIVQTINFNNMFDYCE